MIIGSSNVAINFSVILRVFQWLAELQTPPAKGGNDEVRKPRRKGCSGFIYRMKINERDEMSAHKISSHPARRLGLSVM